MARKTRTIYLYDIQIFVNGQAADDYAAVFERIADLAPLDRVVRRDDRILLLRHVILEADRVGLVVYEGDAGSTVTLFNLEEADERPASSSASEFVVQRTHVVVYLRRKVAAVEYSKRGAKAADVASLLADLAERTVHGTVTLTPRPAESFLDNIEELERIRRVTIVLSRPNPDWTDEFRALTQMAGESRAKEIAVSASAERNGSLEKEIGILGQLKEIVRNHLLPLRDARVEGSLPGSAASTNISLQNQVERASLRVETLDNGQIDTNELLRQMGILIDEQTEP